MYKMIDVSLDRDRNKIDKYSMLNAVANVYADRIILDKLKKQNGTLFNAQANQEILYKELELILQQPGLQTDDMIKGLIMLGYTIDPEPYHVDLINMTSNYDKIVNSEPILSAIHHSLNTLGASSNFTEYDRTFDTGILPE